LRLGLGDDVARRRALQKGEWLATAPFNGVAGFHLSGLYSPWTSLGEAATEFLEAKKLPEGIVRLTPIRLKLRFTDVHETHGDW